MLCECGCINVCTSMCLCVCWIQKETELNFPNCLTGSQCQLSLGMVYFFAKSMFELFFLKNNYVFCRFVHLRFFVPNSNTINLPSVMPFDTVTSKCYIYCHLILLLLNQTSNGNILQNSKVIKKCVLKSAPKFWFAYIKAFL